MESWGYRIWGRRVWDLELRVDGSPPRGSWFRGTGLGGGSVLGQSNPPGGVGLRMGAGFKRDVEFRI